MKKISLRVGLSSTRESLVDLVKKKKTEIKEINKVVSQLTRQVRKETDGIVIGFLQDDILDLVDRKELLIEQLEDLSHELKHIREIIAAE